MRPNRISTTLDNIVSSVSKTAQNVYNSLKRLSQPTETSKRVRLAQYTIPVLLATLLASCAKQAVEPIIYKLLKPEVHIAEVYQGNFPSLEGLLKIDDNVVGPPVPFDGGVAYPKTSDDPTDKEVTVAHLPNGDKKGTRVNVSNNPNKQDGYPAVARGPDGQLVVAYQSGLDVLAAYLGEELAEKVGLQDLSTNNPGRDSSPAAGGNKVAFDSYRNGEVGIYIADLLKGDVTKLDIDEKELVNYLRIGSSYKVMSPDGSRLALPNAQGLKIFDTDTGKLLEDLTEFETEYGKVRINTSYRVDFAADGGLVFTGFVGDNPDFTDSEVFYRSPNGDVTNLSQNTLTEDFSPNVENGIAAWVRLADNQLNIVYQNLITGNTGQITNGGNNKDPVVGNDGIYFRDGTSLYFFQTSNGNNILVPSNYTGN